MAKKDVKKVLKQWQASPPSSLHQVLMEWPWEGVASVHNSISGKKKRSNARITPAEERGILEIIMQLAALPWNATQHSKQGARNRSQQLKRGARK